MQSSRRLTMRTEPHSQDAIQAAPQRPFQDRVFSAPAPLASPQSSRSEIRLKDAFKFIMLAYWPTYTQDAEPIPKRDARCARPTRLSGRGRDDNRYGRTSRLEYPEARLRHRLSEWLLSICKIDYSSLTTRSYFTRAQGHIRSRTTSWMLSSSCGSPAEVTTPHSKWTSQYAYKVSGKKD